MDEHPGAGGGMAAVPRPQPPPQQPPAGSASLAAGGGCAGGGQAGAAPAPAGQEAAGGAELSRPQHYTIPGILHYIQHEWARFEMERAHWEVERAELQVRGERRGAVRYRTWWRVRPGSSRPARGCCARDSHFGC